MKYPQLTKRINAVLAEKGIKKETFYKDCGITSSAYSQWTTGKTAPRLSKLEEIADYLKIPMSYLMGYSQLPVYETTVDAGQQKSPSSEEDERFQMYIKAIDKLTQGDQEKLKVIQDALELAPEQTIAKFELFLKTL